MIPPPLVFPADVPQCGWKERAGNTKRGKYHCTVDLLFDSFGFVCFANKNKICQLSYSWFLTSQTGGQWYSDTSPFSIPCREWKKWMWGRVRMTQKLFSFRRRERRNKGKGEKGNEEKRRTWKDMKWQCRNIFKYNCMSHVNVIKRFLFVIYVFS